MHGWWSFCCEVENGGIAQFFYNHGDVACANLIKLLKASANEPMAIFLAQAVEIYHRHQLEFDTDSPFGADATFWKIKEFKPLDQKFSQKLGAVGKSLEKWLREHISEVIQSENGDPIDPKFTGEVETYYPKGGVYEKASVKNGVMNGEYRRYFEDGVLEHNIFYKGGEVSSDFWGNGQIKHRKSKRGNHTIYEWFFPSGQIQKRLVADKNSDAIEPVRMWYENGQLAEEVSIKGYNKIGPRLRFFEDGAPRLEAHYVIIKGEGFSTDKLIVKNAWDDERRQMVIDGNGTFYDDDFDFSAYYNLVSDSRHPQTHQLRDGVPHGESIFWKDGVIWQRVRYVNGKRQGETIYYYDNGRIRSRATYENDKETASVDFPKFDNPRPAVLLKFLANEFIYTKWKQPLLDVYPTPLNAEEVQAKLEIPLFLAELFHKNKAGTVTERYDDLNSFNDCISYMVIVNSEGEVEKVDFMGASAYSIATINIYPPLIKELRFIPGNIKGHNVPSRINVQAAHTFIEGSS